MATAHQQIAYIVVYSVMKNISRRRHLAVLEEKKAMEEYLEFYKEYENDNQKALQDENAIFIKVPGPHAIWEYPTDKLAEAINSFIGMEL